MYRKFNGELLYRLVNVMDMLDKMIILDLSQNCRQSYQALARKYDITLNAIKNRIQNLLDEGVLEFCIEAQVAMFDGNWAIAFITTTGEEDQKSFIKELGENRMVNEVGTLSGNNYIIYAVYSGLEGLFEFNKFLRSLEPVKDTEVYQILMNRGVKVEISKRQLRILHCLLDDPRMQLSKIAECSGYSAKTVRKVLNEVMESEGLLFGGRMRLNSSDSVAFMVQIEWDEQDSELQDILKWLNIEFPKEYWVPLITVSRPIFFAIFLVESVKEINPIVEKIKKTTFVKSATSIMGNESYSFHDLRRYWLEERFIEAGLKPTLE
jgi:Lrp/AsnC family transcriptional regulator for asnA, asnC and gidA